MRLWLPVLLFLGIYPALWGQPFWSETFGSNQLTNGWSTEDISGQGFEWQICRNGSGCLPEGTRLFSSTATDGFALMVSATNLTLQNPHQSALYSPIFDFSDKPTIVIEFETLIRTFNYNAASNARLWYKIGNGFWNAVPIFSEMDKDFEFQTCRNIKPVLLDLSEWVGGQQAVQFRWEWTGINEEFWALDDVHLYDYHPFYKNTVWGANSGQGDFAGGWNGWTENTLSADNPDTDKWSWDSIGWIGNALAAKTSLFGDNSFYPYLESYSNDNGAMVFNADYFLTGGTTPVGSPYPYNHAELISPTIDLSQVTEEVALEFSQMVMRLNYNSPEFESTTNISYSLDGGRSWQSAIPVNTNLEANKLRNNTIKVNLPGAAGTGNLRVKFIYGGDQYFWVVDDVKIVKRLQNDLRISTEFYSIAPNAVTPISQVEPIAFLCDVENAGIRRQEDVSVSVSVRKKDDGDLVFSDTLHLGAIGPDTTVQDSIFSKNFLPAPEPERYEVSYHVFTVEPDQAEEDNFVNWSFEISEDTYAKEKGPTTQIRPISSPYTFQYGNCFFIPKGNNHEAREVTVGISNTDELPGQNVTVIIYKFYSDENEDGYIEPGEYEIVGLGDYKIIGNEYLLNDGIIRIPVFDLNNEPGIALENNTYYIVSLQYIDASGFSCLMYASQEFDYFPMHYAYQKYGIDRYGAVEEINADFDLFSLGFDLIPLIRLHIAPANSTVRPVINQNQPKVYPNPADAYFTINRFSSGGSLFLKNIKGGTVQEWKVEDFVNFFPLHGHAPGVYFLHFVPNDSEADGWVKRIVITQ